MPQILHFHREFDQFAAFLGANPRPRTPSEDQYHFTRLMRLGAVDLNQPRLMSDKYGRDVRTAISNQMKTGSCTAFTEMEINALLSNADSGAETLIHPGWLYEQTRRKEQTWPQDAGGYEADALDIAMNGAPLFSAAPYQGDNPAFDYSALDTQADKKNNFVQRHMPFYPADGNVLENIWTSIDSGFPVAVAMAWLSPFFSPSGGKLPENQNPADVAGGHEIACFGIVPGFVLCANHWTVGWSADAAQFGFMMRPGDFAIPWSYFTMPNSIIWELRSVAPIAIAPQPDPDPNPQPTPAQSCTTPALKVSDSVLTQLKQEVVSSPFSRPKHYRVEGAQLMRDAIANSGI